MVSNKVASRDGLDVRCSAVCNDCSHHRLQRVEGDHEFSFDGEMMRVEIWESQLDGYIQSLLLSSPHVMAPRNPTHI